MTVETAKKTRTRLHALGELTRDAQARVPTGVTALHQQARECDGYPSTASASGEQQRGSGELNAVEAAAHRLLGDIIPHRDGRMRPGPLPKLERIAHLIGVASAAIHELITIADNVNPPEKMDSRSQCVAGEGYAWWMAPKSNPTKVRCDNPQEDGRSTGLCSSCRGRKQRWEATT
jgi:hypothetical protein